MASEAGLPAEAVGSGGSPHVVGNIADARARGVPEFPSPLMTDVGQVGGERAGSGSGAASGGGSSADEPPTPWGGGAGAGAGAGAGITAEAAAAEAAAAAEVAAAAIAEIAARAPPDFVSRVRLVVWDFDLTLLRIHSYAEMISAEDVRRRRDVAADFVDLPFFRALVGYLRGAGVRVAVASFGKYDTIAAYLTAALGDGVFDRSSISTPAAVGGTDGCSLARGKNTQLDDLCRRFGVAAKQSVLFFDDDPKNIDFAVAAGYSKAFRSPRGFSRSQWFETMQALADAPSL